VSSVVFICNLALSNLGKDNIEALSDSGAEARACRQFYEITRNLLLEAYPWRWAEKVQSMAEVVNAIPGDWAFAYNRPEDCVKVLSVHPDRGSALAAGNLPARGADYRYGVPYDISGPNIYCDLSPAFLRYTKRATDPTQYPATFIDALSWQLSVRLAMPLTRDKNVRSDAWAVAKQMSSEAMVNDANEVRETSDHDGDLEGARS